MTREKLGATEHKSVLTQVRILQILSALGRAGILPSSAADIHAFAFFSNVMSPLWDLEPLEGAVLKAKDGPYYPFLQTEIDRLVGAGFVEVADLAFDLSSNTVRTTSTSFKLNTAAAESVLACAGSLPDEQETLRFLTELAFSFAEIGSDLRSRAALWDATYSDPAVSEARVIDFAEWNSPLASDHSVQAANQFQKYAPTGVTFNRAEKLGLYMTLVARRAHG